VQLVEGIVSTAILLVAAIAFSCRSETGSRALAGAAFLLAAARLQFLVLPATGPDWITARDGVRLVAYTMLLGAAVRRLAETRRRATAALLAAERERIARDLHDGLAQDLAYIALQGQRLTSELGSQDELTAAARRALAASRGVISDLSASDASSTGLALVQVADELSARFGADVSAKVTSAGEQSQSVDVEAGRREQVVRIAREAILNALRHGEAGRVDVVLDCTGRELRLTVTDDGRGMTEARLRRRDGYGLAIMRARAASLGGRLLVSERPSGGMRLEVAFPAGRSASDVRTVAPRSSLPAWRRVVARTRARGRRTSNPQTPAPMDGRSIADGVLPGAEVP
jgi:signal transduction histidine kinase